MRRFFLVCLLGLTAACEVEEPIRVPPPVETEIIIDELPPSPPPPPPPVLNCQRDVEVSPFSTDGRMVTFDNFALNGLVPRRVRVLLPEGYSEDAVGYPVLYAHDGQNLFDDSEAAFGVEWRVDENLDFITAEGRVRAHIVVAIDNTGERISEYTPDADPEFGGGQGDLYLDGIVNQLKPQIDSAFNTACGISDTAMMGSSLGGLITLRALERHGDVFGRGAALSPSLWWNDQSLTARIEAQGFGFQPLRIWVDGGSAEGEALDDGLSSTLANNRRFTRALNFPFGRVVGLSEIPGAGHNEAAWAARVGAVMRFVLGDEDFRSAPDFMIVRAWNPKVASDAGAKLSVEVVNDFLSMSFPIASDVDVPFTVDLGAFALDGDALTASGSGAALVSATWEDASTARALQQFGRDDEVAVGFSVRVPAGTEAVYVFGSTAALGAFDEGAGLELTRADDGSFVGVSFAAPGERVAYKYTRGSWSSVEKFADGSERPDRELNLTSPHLTQDEVAAWAE